jgi:hypothetical protein
VDAVIVLQSLISIAGVVQSESSICSIIKTVNDLLYFQRLIHKYSSRTILNKDLVPRGYEYAFTDPNKDR